MICQQQSASISRSSWRQRIIVKSIILLLGAIAIAYCISIVALGHFLPQASTRVLVTLDIIVTMLLVIPFALFGIIRPLLCGLADSNSALTALHDSEELFRTIVNGLHDAIVLHDMEGKILSVNDKMLKLYGVEQAQVIGKTIADFSSPHCPIETISDILAKVCAGESQLFEWQGCNPNNGQIFDIEVYLRKVVLHGEDVILASIRDINERKRIQEALRKSESEFRTIFESAGIGIAMVDTGKHPINANPALRQMLGYSAEELAALSLKDITHPDDVETDMMLYQELLTRKRSSYQIEKRYIRKDGTILWARLTVTIIRSVSDGTIENYSVSLIEDITDRKAVEDQLQLVAKVIDNTVEGVTITDKHSTIISVNPAFTTITGYSPEEVIGKTPRILKSDQHDAEFYRQMWHSLLEKGHWQGEIWNRRKSGEAYPEWLTISAIHDGHGRATHYVAVFHDITENKQNEAQIKYQAYHDALTGLPNRQLFNDRLSYAVAHAQRNKSLIAVFFIDLDRFKNINDTLGHLIGDHLLQAVAEQMSCCIRKDDTVARLGGDEFTMILTDIDHEEDAVKVAQKVIDLFKQPFTIDGHELFTSPSIGISIFPYDGQEPDQLMKNADTALYRAKEHGRNNYQLYTPGMNAKAFERLELETSLRRALERQEFLLHYQPRIDMITGRAQSTEALVRWQHPKLGLVPPGDFIPLAEETGLIVPIGEWVLWEACTQAKTWINAGLPPIRVAVNLSARQFSQDSLVQVVADTLRDTGLDARYLELEITESAAMQHGAKSIQMLNELHALGVHLSIDDFGTGYSSLGYLKKFPVDALKIDQSFVRDIPQDQDDAAIATAVIALAHTLNLRVIAEGVENKEQLAFMNDHQCDEIQGYFFSKPLPKDLFEQQFLVAQQAEDEQPIFS